MHSAVLRALVFLAAAAVIGAATHANVVHANRATRQPRRARLSARIRAPLGAAVQSGDDVGGLHLA